MTGHPALPRLPAPDLPANNGHRFDCRPISLGPLRADGLLRIRPAPPDGFDLREAPLVERKRVLAALLEEAKSECFHLAQHLEVAPALVFEQACALGLEGIVCKLRDAPYRSGARASWLEIKCFKHGVFPIIGFIPTPGAIAALHLARRAGKALAYAGRAGTGFTQKSARELRQVLDALAIERPPLKGAPLRPKSTWVRPELSAAIEYTAITREGLLRHASFKGLGLRGRTHKRRL